MLCRRAISSCSACLAATGWFEPQRVGGVRAAAAVQSLQPQLIVKISRVVLSCLNDGDICNTSKTCIRIWNHNFLKRKINNFSSAPARNYGIIIKAKV